MGSDTHPGPEAEAAVRLAREFREELILVGDETVLNPALKAAGSASGDRIRLVHAAEVLGMSDKAAASARTKAESSMAVGIGLVKNDLADGFVTAGNTGGAMAAALFGLGRLPGVKRPAVSPTLPVEGGSAVLIDSGANVDCKPEYLLQFGILGSTYAQKMMGVDTPRVGLLSHGEEPGKGNEAVRAAYPLLQASGLNFVGNVEGRDFFAGKVDVLVADGFAGNVLLKTAEGVARFMSNLIARELARGPLTIAGGVLAKPAFRRVRATLDPSEYGAVPLLGVNGLVFIGHGRSDAKAIYNAVRAARRAVEAGLLEAMRTAMGPGNGGDG